MYLFACLTIINYTQFKENQRIFLIYLMTYGLSYIKLFNISTTLIFLVVVTFVYIEVLSSDDEKLRMFTKFRFKIADYLFFAIFQYHIFWVIISVIFTSNSVKTWLYDRLIFIANNYFSIINNILKQYYVISIEQFSSAINLLSIFLFIIGAIKIISQKFKVKNITELMKYFKEKPINLINLSEINPVFFEMIVDLEDKTYFIRRNSYNFFSWEFLKYKKGKISNYLKQGNAVKEVSNYVSRSKNIRGYSTIEMQLIRTIGIERGYTKTLLRKIYEIVYSRIFFRSLKDFYDENRYAKRHEFKKYLLYIYFHNVNTKIASVVYKKMSSVYNEDIPKWTKEEFFVACIGLTHASFSFESIKQKYLTEINKYKLDEQQIFKIINKKENNGKNNKKGKKGKRNNVKAAG